eukprot:SAG31_NODE_4880_length_2887_cov_3.746413_4_plen_95_part_00
MQPPPCAQEDAALHGWLARTAEEPLERDLPICDPHHHLWCARAAPLCLSVVVAVLSLPGACCQCNGLVRDARAGEGGAHIVDARPGGPVDPAAR